MSNNFCLRVVIGLLVSVTTHVSFGQEIFSIKPVEQYTKQRITFSKGDDIIIWSKNKDLKRKIKGKLLAKNADSLIIKPYFKKENFAIALSTVQALKRPNYKRAVPIALILITAGILTSDPDSFLFSSPLNWAIPLGVYGILENQVLRKKMRIDEDSDRRKRWEIISK